VNNFERRRAILLGVQAAARIHTEFKLNKHLEHRSASSIDVFRLITEHDIFLLFKPLKNLLGGAMRDSGQVGILVSTNRSLHIQRFTAAHELGHIVLNHEVSLDNEIGQRGQFGTRNDPQELAADAFASELLAPKWLIKWHCARHKWTSDSLSSPVTTYQLSLRLGMSYEATCWALQSHRILTPATAERLRSNEPKRIKALVLENHHLENSWANAWWLNPADTGLHFEGGPNDVFRVSVKEHAGSGYLWNFSSDLHPMNDKRLRLDSNCIGGSVDRDVWFAAIAGETVLVGQESRPFDKADVIQKLHVRLSLHTLKTGLPRHQRPQTTDETGYDA